MQERYLEDFAVGQTYRTSTVRVQATDMINFAAEFDPQPFHVDEQAARTSFFGGLVASGWYTGALTARLLVGSDIKPAGGIISAGLDEVPGAPPGRAGDELQGEVEVLAVRPSKSRPQHGLIKLKATTNNQNGEPVQVLVGN